MALAEADWERIKPPASKDMLDTLAEKTLPDPVYSLTLMDVMPVSTSAAQEKTPAVHNSLLAPTHDDKPDPKRLDELEYPVTSRLVDILADPEKLALPVNVDVPFTVRLPPIDAKLPTSKLLDTEALLVLRRVNPVILLFAPITLPPNVNAFICNVPELSDLITLVPPPLKLRTPLDAVMVALVALTPLAMSSDPAKELEPVPEERNNAAVVTLPVAWTPLLVSTDPAENEEEAPLTVRLPPIDA